MEPGFEAFPVMSQKRRHRRPSQPFRPGMATTKEVCFSLRTLLKRHRLLLLALVLGLSGFTLSYNVLSFYVKTEPVVVAACDLEPYHKIVLSDVKVVELPLKSIHARSVRRPQDIAGQFTMAKVFAGQILLDRQLMSSKDQPGLSMEIPLNERGIFIPAETSRAVGGLINPGDRVDLIWSQKGPDFYSEGGTARAKTVMLGARVVHVINDKSSGEFKGVVITALPETCERIAHYLESGNIYLSLISWGVQEDSVSIDAEVWPET